MVRIIYRAAFVLFCTVGVGSAYAEVSSAISVKYFDENGAVVGQQITTCNFSRSQHYGNIHTAYKISEAAPCEPGGTSHPSPIVPDTRVTAYTLPGFLTIQQACLIAQCASKEAIELDYIFPYDQYQLGWN